MQSSAVGGRTVSGHTQVIFDWPIPILTRAHTNILLATDYIFSDIHSQQQQRLASSARTLYGLNPSNTAATTTKSTAASKAIGKGAAAASSSVGAGAKRKRVLDEDEEDFDGPVSSKSKSKVISKGTSAVDSVNVKVEKGVGFESEVGAVGVDEDGANGDVFEEGDGGDSGFVEGNTPSQHQ